MILTTAVCVDMCMAMSFFINFTCTHILLADMLNTAMGTLEAKTVYGALRGEQVEKLSSLPLS